MANNQGKSRYSSLIEAIFLDKYHEGDTVVPFQRDDLVKYSAKLGMPVPKNIGDVLYSFRYRAKMPDAIVAKAPENKQWVITGVGSASYVFKLCNMSNVLPNPAFEEIPILDNTPEVISVYQLSDEQSLLSRIRYNRLLDIFLGIVTYSMQNHLRTQVKGVGQIEIDELYVGVNKKGQHFIIPVEAKVGNDMVGVVQLNQDIAYCKQAFPDLICVPVAVHKMENPNTLCLFHLKMQDEDVKVVDEKHYRLVYSQEMGRQELAERNSLIIT